MLARMMGRPAETLDGEICGRTIYGCPRQNHKGNAAEARYFSVGQCAGLARGSVADGRAYAQGITTDTVFDPGLTTARLRILPDPWLAYALARAGDITGGARAVIDATPDRLL